MGGNSASPWLRSVLGTTRAVPCVVGVVLLSAAGLKAHQVAVTLKMNSAGWKSSWPLIGIVQLELTLGLCLFLGVYRRQIRVAAVVCFTALGAISLYQALAGRASCGCFGVVAVSPWYTFLFDMGAVVGLWRWCRVLSSSSNVATVGQWFMLGSALAVGLVLVPASIIATVAWRHDSVPVLTVLPEVIELGEVFAGRGKDVAFSLTNSSTISVSVARIETSCHCLKIELPTHHFVAGETVMGHACLDLREAPTFAGSLGVEVKGLDRSGTVVFAIVVNAEVLRG